MRIPSTPEARADRRRIRQAGRLHLTCYRIQKFLYRMEDGVLRCVGAEVLSPYLGSRYQAKKKLGILRRTYPTARLVVDTWFFSDKDAPDARERLKRRLH